MSIWWRSWRGPWWVCCGALLVLGWLRPLALPDEGRYGDIGRFMMVSGDWLAPRLDGVPFFHKPPLLHWLQAAALSLAGVHPWVSRWVPMAHAGLMLGVMAWATQRLYGPQVARGAVWMLGSSLAFLIGGQYINHDMLVAAWIGIAIWCFGLAIMDGGTTPHRGLALCGFAACGVGVLAKGLIGLVLPGLVMFVWLTVTRAWPRALRWPWLSGLALFAAITLPWFIWVELRHPSVFNYLIIGHHFGRYTGTTFNNPWPWWFFPLILCGLLFPWAFVAYGAGLRGLWRGLSQPKLLRRQPDPAHALMWVWLLAITVFFSFPRSKLVGYILPVLPPLAVLAACAWQRHLAERRWSAGVFALLCLLGMGLGVWGNHAATQYTWRKSSADVAQTLACEIQPGDAVWVAGDYPYDLPYLAGLSQPVVVLADWPLARRQAGDNWQREMFEGASFDPAMSERVMQDIALLNQPQAPGVWLVTPSQRWQTSDLPHWQAVMQGRAWVLWRSAASASKSPIATQDKSLRCGHAHGQPQ
ncbi:MAG: glycosyltransferase family 39 protein [Alphaproteobacteria bacterium]|nr:glycosyltransferase family 39 protein [Alphaproteobacteria bacterium]